MQFNLQKQEEDEEYMNNKEMKCWKLKKRVPGFLREGPVFASRGICQLLLFSETVGSDLGPETTH